MEGEAELSFFFAFRSGLRGGGGALLISSWSSNLFGVFCSEIDGH